MLDVRRAIELALKPLDFASVQWPEAWDEYRELYWEEGHRAIGEWRNWQAATDGEEVRIIAPDGSMYARELYGEDEEDWDDQSLLRLSKKAIDAAIAAAVSASGQLDLLETAAEDRS